MPQPLRTTVLVGCFVVWDSNGSFHETASFESLVFPKVLRVEGKEKELFEKWIVKNQSLNENEQEDNAATEKGWRRI